MLLFSDDFVVPKQRTTNLNLDLFHFQPVTDSLLLIPPRWLIDPEIKRNRVIPLYIILESLILSLLLF